MEAHFLFLKKSTTFQLCLVHFDILLRTATKIGKKKRIKGIKEKK